jgi:predicted dehydrogenase
MRKIGVVLVGLGPGSEPHLVSLAALKPRVELLWCISNSANPKRPDLIPAGARVSSDLAQALADPQVDAVVLATPANTHLALAAQVLAAGKHLLMEKPLDVSLARAERLVDLAHASGLCFGVVLQHRFRPSTIRLRELMATNALGSLQAGYVQVPWWRSQSAYYDIGRRGTLERDGGGVLLTQAIHTIDLFRSLVGVKRVVAAQAITTDLHRIETEDFVSALLTLGNGALGNLMATTASYPGRPESIELIFTSAHVSLVGGCLEVHYHDGRTERVEGDSKTGSGDSIMDFSPAAHTALQLDFFDAIEQQRQPQVTGREALLTHRLIEDILAVAAATS